MSQVNSLTGISKKSPSKKPSLKQTHNTTSAIVTVESKEVPNALESESEAVSSVLSEDVSAQMQKMRLQLGSKGLEALESASHTVGVTAVLQV